MPRPQPLVALHGAVDFSRFIPFDAEPSAPPLQVNDILVMRRAAGGPNVLVSVGDIQAHTGSVNIADLLGGANNDMLFRTGGVWTGSGASGLEYDGASMSFDGSNIDMTGGASVNVDDAGNIVLAGTGQIRAGNATGFGLFNVAASGTVPTVRPNRADPSGLGQTSTSHFSAIAASTEVARFRHVTNSQLQLKPATAFQNAPGSPLLQFHNSALGFYCPVANVISMAVLGVQKWSFTADAIQSAGSGGAIRFATPSLTVPTLLWNSTDLDSGWGSGGTNNGVLILAGKRAVNWRATLAADGSIEYTADLTSSTASTTQTQGQNTQNSPEWSQITTVANADDVITLGGAAAGRKTQVCNQGANQLQIFPTLGDDLGLGVNTPMFLGVGESTTFLGLSTSLWQRVAGKGSFAAGGAVFPELVFDSADFDNPNNADWDENALAPAVADSNNNALTIRAYDDTLVEGVGGFMNLPADAVNFTLSLVGRAETAPVATRQVRMSLRVREIPDNAAVTAPPWITANLANMDIPTNEFFQFDSETFTFAFFGFAAGELIQFELVRVNTVVGTDLTGDYDLLQLRINFA